MNRGSSFTSSTWEERSEVPNLQAPTNSFKNWWTQWENSDLVGGFNPSEKY